MEKLDALALQFFSFGLLLIITIGVQIALPSFLWAVHHFKLYMDRNQTLKLCLI